MSASGRKQPIEVNLNERLVMVKADIRIRRYRGNTFERLLHFA